MLTPQPYCTANEVTLDMGRDGNTQAVHQRIAAASMTIKHNIGNFIPITETRCFAVTARNEAQSFIYIPAILGIDALKINDVEVTDFELQPSERQWSNGPYIKVVFSSPIHLNDEIEITGRWGLYEEIAASGLTGSQTTASEKTLVVSDASELCPEMILLIEDEQEYISAGNGGARSPEPTEATSLLADEVSEADQIFSVDDGSEFHAGETIRIDSEDMLIVKIASDDLTVERGWNGSQIATHDDDEKIYVYRTYAVERGVNGTTAAAHASKAIQRLMVPDDVNWLARQITGLMIKKADSGFQGRVGNSETGQSMFYSEFPPSQMAEVKNHYPNFE